MLRGSVSVVAIEMTAICKKMMLPNGKVVDILSEVFDEIRKWLQDDITKPEAGGYISGYQDNKTGNITLESISTPYSMDKRNRCFFGMKDPRHKLFLFKKRIDKSFYMGVWHTPHQTVPIPSSIDWADWYGALNVDKTACEYMFFIIAGTDKARIWVGDYKSNKITEIFECNKKNGLYIKNSEEQDK